MNFRISHILRTLALGAVFFATTSQSFGRANDGAPINYLPISFADLFSIFNSDNYRDNFFTADTTRYPVTDRYGDPYTNYNRNPFNLSDTSFVKRNVIYDPLTKQYYIEEKIGTQYYRTPVAFSMQDFLTWLKKKCSFN